MNPFAYQRATAPDAAIRAVSAPGAKFLGGGTNLIDLMKDDVEHPTLLVDINHLELTRITNTPAGGVMIGALVRNSDLANHELIKTNYPLLSEAAPERSLAATPEHGDNGRQPPPADPVLLLHRHRLSGLQQAQPRQRMRRHPGFQSHSRHPWSK